MAELTLLRAPTQGLSSLLPKSLEGVFTGFHDPKRPNGQDFLSFEYSRTLMPLNSKP